MAFINFHKCLSEPKYFLRLMAIISCLGIAFFQLSECINKILHPPISTHYTFALNQTMQYPSITLCRNPPYKTSVYEKFGLSPGGNPTQTAFWKNFKYDKYTLDEFFAQASFEFNELVQFYGFDSLDSKVNVTSFIKLRHGKCFKMTPKNYSEVWNSALGYFLYLRHTETNRVRFTTATASLLAGFHIYVHEPREIITENNDQNESFMEYIYVEAGEDLAYTLRINEYNQLPSKDNNCELDHDYSKSKCHEDCIQNRILQTVNCSTPWMNNTNYPRCNNYDQLKKAVEYSKKEYIDKCECLNPCNISIYIPYAQSRKENEYPGNSILSIYYASNLVTVMEEITGYDWNLFLADLGGSLGFLLGLSVLGIIGAMEQILKLCFGIKSNKPDKKKEAPTIFVNDKKLDDDFYEKKSDLNYYLDYYGETKFYDRNNIKY